MRVLAVLVVVAAVALGIRFWYDRPEAPRTSRGPRPSAQPEVQDWRKTESAKVSSQELLSQHGAGPSAHQTREVQAKDLLSVLAIFENGNVLRALVRYRPNAGIEAPAGTPAVATADPESGFLHLMALQDSCWRPFQHMRLVAFGKQRDSVIIERHLAGADAAREELFRTWDPVPQEVLAELLGAAQTSAKPPEATPVPSAPGEPAPVSPNPGPKTPQTPTRETAHGTVELGSDDREYLEGNMQSILERQPMRDYVGSKGLRGVMAGKIADPALARLGLREGDVLLRVNGQATATRADAIAVCRDQYRRGVRSFVADVLRDGQVETRTIAVGQ